jgi:hypothetical protein
VKAGIIESSRETDGGKIENKKSDRLAVTHLGVLNSLDYITQFVFNFYNLVQEQLSLKFQNLNIHCLLPRLAGVRQRLYPDGEDKRYILRVFTLFNV